MSYQIRRADVIRRIELTNEKHQLFGLADSGLTTLGSFNTMVDLDGLVIKINFHVVREKDSRFGVIIGNDILKSVDIVLKGDEVEFRKREVAVGDSVAVVGSKSVVDGKPTVEAQSVNKNQ